MQAGQVYSVEIDYRRVGGFFDAFEQGGLTGIQASWASLEAPPNFVKYDAVVICAGISNEYEGEGEDRSFTLPEFQDELIKNLSTANHHTIVEFFGGGNFDSHEWIGQVPALIETFYPGQNGGQALAEILFGDVNPSGKLPVTFEKRLQIILRMPPFPPLSTHIRTRSLIPREFSLATGATNTITSSRSFRSALDCLTRRFRTQT